MFLSRLHMMLYLLWFVVLLLFCTPLASVASPDSFEIPPVFHASEVLPKELIQGPNFQVQDTVYNDGIQNRYELTTSFGTLTVEGTDLLKVRIQEIQALRRMEALKRTDLYIDGLKKAATAPLELGVGLVTAPVDTIKGVGTGVGKWFGNIGHSVWGGASEREEGTLKTVLGYDSTKRKFAYEFDVDPYSTNETLQARLKEISWTAFAGNLTVRAAFMGISDVAGIAVRGTSFSGGMNKLIRDRTPAELKEANAQKLTTMGVHSSVAEVFLEHPKYSPTEKTFLVGALETMSLAKNRESFIAVATLAQEESMAFFRRRQAEMIAGFHQNIAPVKRFVRLGKGSFIEKKDGTLVGIFPIDHLAWTRDVGRTANLISRDAGIYSKAPGKELWIGGTVSTKARKNLESAGWTVKENVSHQSTLR